MTTKTTTTTSQPDGLAHAQELATLAIGMIAGHASQDDGVLLRVARNLDTAHRKAMQTTGRQILEAVHHADALDAIDAQAQTGA